MIYLKTEEEIELLRENNLLVSRTLAEVGRHIAPGVTTKELDTLAEDFIRSHGAVPAFLGYQGFPASLCISINEEVVHGIPSSKRVLREGDIVSVDCGTFMKGFVGDSAYTFAVGEVAEEVRQLMEVTKEALRKGTAQAKAGNRVGDISAAVQEYAESKDFDRVDRIKRDILTLYRADIVKHATGYEMKVESIFDEIPAQLQKHEKRFKLSSLKKEARFREYEDALFWLDDAMIVNTCYNSTAPNIGLKLNMDRLTLKCYMADTGLLISHAFDENGIVSEEIYKKILFDKLEVNMGMIVENVVAQMLVVSGHKLYFYSNPSREDKNARMEIDFLIAKDKISNRHNISPIEVKSSTRYTLTSLRKFVTKYKEQTHIPYVIHPNDFKEEDGIVYLPLYMTPML